MASSFSFTIPVDAVAVTDTSGPLPIHVQTHEAEALEKLIQQYRDKSRQRAWVASYAKPIQDIEDLLWEILESRFLDVAIGEQLRVLGRIVGETKGAYSDAAFRIIIRAKIKVLRSSGTFPELLEIVRLLLDDPLLNVRGYQNWPAGLVIEILEGPVEMSLISRMLRQAVSGGVRLDLIMIPQLEIDTFTFSDVGVTTPGTQGFSDVGLTVGGYWPTIL